MNKLFFLAFLLALMGCSPYKPPLDETQVVNGNSIIVPPEFNKLPKEKQNEHL